jgi:hypothetical protein
MKKIGYDNMKFDALQIVEDTRCCLKVNAVITKEGVYPYPDGRAFKSRPELLSATHTARNAKITILDHPDSLVIMSQKQIHGVVEKPFFDRDRIRATLNFDKSVCPKDFVDSVRAGTASKDVSIGFYYQPDMTPGVWQGKNYDYVMRDIVIDHVAVGVQKGRCSFPDCGIGVDSVVKQLSFKEDRVEQRGNRWCVVHCHGEEAGTVIKCFDTRAEAEAMHRAIQAQKHDEIEGGKKELSEIKPEEFAAFVKGYVAAGHTEEQAKEYWDQYVIVPKETPPASATPPIVAKPSPETPKEPEKVPETPPSAPATPSPAPPTPPPEMTAEQLIDRSNELLKMREQKVIEEQRADRRHPA